MLHGCQAETVLHVLQTAAAVALQLLCCWQVNRTAAITTPVKVSEHACK